MTDLGQETERPRWVLIAVLAIVGLLLLVAGSFVVDWKDPWPYLSSVAVNIGTALGLAGLLVWFERNFMRKVQRSQNDAVYRAASEAADQTAKSFRTTLSELNSRIDALGKDRAARASAAIDALAETLGYTAARAAIDEATAIHAIKVVGDNDEAVVIIPAGTSPDSPLLSLRSHHEFEKFSDAGYMSELEPAGIEVGFVPRDQTTPTTVVEWRDDQDLVDVLDELKQGMFRDGHAGMANGLDAHAFVVQLQTALKESVAARRSLPSKNFAGNTVYEWLWNGWAITEVGLEIPNAEYLAIDGSRYPTRYFFEGRQSQSYSPDIPEGIDSEVWLPAENRARAHFNYRGEKI